jgi:G-protein signaling modulator 2
MEDQRSAIPITRPAPTVPDEDFFSLIQKVQSSRLDEQRTRAPKQPPDPGKKNKKK